MWPFNIYRIFEARERYIWIQVRILHETYKAILVTAPCHSRESGNPNNDNVKIWIPKSQICGIRLRKGVFEIYVEEKIVG